MVQASNRNMAQLVYLPKGVAQLQAIGVELEVWTVDSLEVVDNLHPYVTGVSSNWILAGEYLANKNNNHQTD